MTHKMELLVAKWIQYNNNALHNMLTVEKITNKKYLIILHNIYINYTTIQLQLLYLIIFRIIVIFYFFFII
jgi:hypothetical protein